jgi:hypothetical protein
LTPGAIPLAAWRAIYFGADVSLAAACRPTVYAGAATIDRIVALGAVMHKYSIRPIRARANARDAAQPAPSGRTGPLLHPDDAEISRRETPICAY